MATVAGSMLTDGPMVVQHCIACYVRHTATGSVFCTACKADSDKVHQRVMQYIQRYERTFNVAFFTGEPLACNDVVSDALPTEEEMLADTTQYCMGLVSDLRRARTELERKEHGH